MNKRFYTVTSVVLAFMLMLGGCCLNDAPTISDVTEARSEQTSVSERVSESEIISETFTPTEITEETTIPEATETTVLETTVAETIAFPVTETTTTAAETAPFTEKTTVSVSLAPSSGSKPSLEEITRPYPYSFLTEKEKQIYDIFEGAAVSLSNKADFAGMSVTKAELENAVYAFDLYEPLYSYISLKDCVIHSKNGYVQYVDMAYYYDKSSHQKMTEAVRSAADKIIAKITPDMTEYDVVKLLHDEIVRNCVYDETAQNRNFAYGALVDGRATCTGYARAFNYLCNRVGIENTCAFGMAGGEGHMWNMVKLDGEWYEVDTTWDDSSSEGFEGFIYYDYFLVTTASMSDRELFEYNIAKPLATGTKYNYYTMTSTYAEDEATLEAAMYNCLKIAAENNEKYAQFKYKDSSVLSMIEDFAQSGRMFGIVKRAENDTGYVFNKSEMKYYTSNNDTIVVISI